MRAPIFYSSFFLLATYVACQSNPLVRVKQGVLSGIWEVSANGKTYASFKGVPYARPPIGKYRFREPQALKPWPGVWDASKYNPVCLQYDPMPDTIVGSESCLFLNVYTPNPTAGANLPVLVYIHGGAFMFGGSTFYSPAYLMNKDLVVVTVNYRLGPLGFLSTGDEVVPGNNGLKDQSFALRWVKENILMFGGNPDSITLSGCSAGGASVSYHYLSPMSRGTFARGIAFSGASFVPWAQAAKPAEKARTLGSLVGCSSPDSRELAECLRFRPAEALVQAQADMMAQEWRAPLFTPFIPTVESATVRDPFLNQKPYQVAVSGGMAKVPLLTTFTAAEGLYPGAWYQRDESYLQDLEARWPDLAAYIFEYNDTLPVARRPAVAEKIKEFYLGGKPVSQDTYNQLIEALGDRMFVSHVAKLAKVHAEKSGQPTYVYKYSFRGKVSLTPVLSMNDKDYGASHADDNFHIFLMGDPAPEDKQMSDALIDLVYSYASMGVPKFGNAEWPPVKPGAAELDYIDILSPKEAVMKSTIDLGNSTFWESLGFAENQINVNIKNEL